MRLRQTGLLGAQVRTAGPVLTRSCPEGQTEVARMVVLTADKRLRSQLDELYRSRFAANVVQLTATAGK